jgi:hypothetical protein
MRSLPHRGQLKDSFSEFKNLKHWAIDMEKNQVIASRPKIIDPLEVVMNDFKDKNTPGQIAEIKK